LEIGGAGPPPRSILDDGKCEESIKRHINVVKAHFSYLKKIGPNHTLVPKVSSLMSLDLQMSFLKLTMKIVATS